MPIIFGVQTEFDLLFDVPYYIQANDNPVNMEYISVFDEIHKKPIEIVAQEIREFGQKRFDYDIVFAPVIKKIYQNLEKGL